MRNRDNEGVVSVEFTFKNDEIAVVPRLLLIDVEFHEYNKMFTRGVDNNIEPIETFDFIYISIHRDIRTQGLLRSAVGKSFDEDVVSALERLLNSNDITKIEFIYEDSLAHKNFSVCPIWKGGYENEFQDIKLNKGDDVEILIASPQTRDKHADLLAHLTDKFKNSEKLNLTWLMYND